MQTEPPNHRKSGSNTDPSASPTTMRHISVVGNQLLGLGTGIWTTGALYFRNISHSTPKLATAPICTAKKMPGRPLFQKKSLKFILYCAAISMLGGSPISVAVPCRFDAMAIPIRKGAGDVFSFRASSMAIGATINTVATLAAKMLMKLDIAHTPRIAQHTFGLLSISQSLSTAGALL